MLPAPLGRTLKRTRHPGTQAQVLPLSCSGQLFCNPLNRLGRAPSALSLSSGLHTRRHVLVRSLVATTGPWGRGGVTWQLVPTRKKW